MTRQEFIDVLSAKLYEELPAAEVPSQIQYYQGYLDGEIARGRSEEEAVAELGDPHLIAKTIIESPRQENAFGGNQSQADAYFEGAYQAENESRPGDISHGRHEESTSYGTSGGRHEESASHGRHEESTSYGTSGGRHEESTSHGHHEESASYGTSEGFHKEAESRGSYDASSPGGGAGSASGRDSGGQSASRGESVHGTVETGKHSFLRDGNGEFNWPLFAGILAVVMIFVAVVWLVTRVVIVFGPVLLILLAILLVVRTIRGDRRR